MPRRPDLRLESEETGTVAGVDEAGCAPLAGPVVAAAVILPRWTRRPRSLRGLTDSKQLPEADRERLYEAIVALARVGVGAAGVREIDRCNILRANMLAMARAVAALRAPVDVALVDGNRAPPLPCRVRTVVKGDARSLSIAAASVVAKVTRDRLMRRLARRYPAYRWDANKGYPTEDHYLALMAQGPTGHHRLSFAPLADGAASRQLALGLQEAARAADGAALGLCRLRQDLVVVLDGVEAVAMLKNTRAGWRLRAAVEASPPAASPSGPLAAWHGALLAAPTLAALRAAMQPPAEAQAWHQVDGRGDAGMGAG